MLRYFMLGMGLMLVFITVAANIPNMSRTEALIAATILLTAALGGGVWYSGALDWLSWRNMATNAPAEQRHFLDLAEAPGRTEIAPGRAALCGVPAAAANWTGKVGWNYLTLGDKATLSVQIAPHIVLRGASGFDGRGSWISSGTPLFAKVAALKTGDAVRFSGRFETDHQGCLQQGASAADGGKSDAEFLFTFDDVLPGS